MKIVGLNLHSSCAPVVVWRDTTGPTGVLTLRCGATFTNATHYRLLVWADTEYTDGRTQKRTYQWNVYPGAPTMTLPPPPPGAYWMLYTQTAYQRTYGTFLEDAGKVAVGGFALLGILGTIGLVAARHHRPWRGGRP